MDTTSNIVTSPSRTTYLYTLSISRFSSLKSQTLIGVLPSRYYSGYVRCGAWDGTNGDDVCDPRCGSLGVHSIGFRFSSADANAFRKWVQRRYGYRATFRRAVVESQNWVQGMLFDPQRLAQL